MSSQTPTSTIVQDVAKGTLQRPDIQKVVSEGLSSVIGATRELTIPQAIVASSGLLCVACVSIKAAGVAKKVMFNAIGKGQGVKWELGPFKLTTTTPNTAA